MADPNEAELSTVEREILWNAVEGTYLIEIRNDVPAPDYPLATYRAEVSAALQRLADAGLITFRQGSWSDRDDSTTIGADQVRNRLDDGSAWDPDRADLIIIEATAVGRDLAMAS
jgi:hypothetical protein